LGDATADRGWQRHLAAHEQKETQMSNLDLSETDDAPVLNTLAAITAVSLENCDLDPRDLMLVRIAALAAVDAPPMSYLLNAGAAVEAGITLDDVEGVFVGIAPIIGTPRTVAAAANVMRALGFAVAVADAELEDAAG
jgi:hypothetical protein